MRTVITGIPRSGKTTLANSDEDPACPVLATDDLIGWLPWSELSQFVADRFDALGAVWTIEGVAAVRALRKWLAAHPEGKPCDVVYFLDGFVVPEADLLRGQKSMAKGCRKIWLEIASELARRDVTTYVEDLSDEAGSV